jgi:hypothetical protein
LKSLVLVKFACSVVVVVVDLLLAFVGEGRAIDIEAPFLNSLTRHQSGGRRNVGREHNRHRGTAHSPFVPDDSESNEPAAQKSPELLNTSSHPPSFKARGRGSFSDRGFGTKKRGKARIFPVLCPISRVELYPLESAATGGGGREAVKGGFSGSMGMWRKSGHKARAIPRTHNESEALAKQTHAYLQAD